MFGGKQGGGSGGSSGKTKGRVNANPHDAIQKLESTYQQQEKREKHLEKQITDLDKKIKQKIKAKDRRGAATLLKRKKMIDKQLMGVAGMKTNIMSQKMALEDGINQVTVVNAMKDATAAMTVQQQQVNVEDVEDLIENAQEAKDMQNEVTDLLANPFADEFDEDDIMAELDELEELETEMAFTDLPEVNTTTMPAQGITTTEPTNVNTVKPAANTEEDELAMLMM